MAGRGSDLIHLRVDAVAFDLDGTLVDSAADIGHALNSALTKAGLRRFDLHTVRNWIGDGPDALIERALSAQGLVGTQDDALHSRLRRAFDVSTLASPLSYGRVYDGIPALLAALAERMPIVVVTNKPTPLARAVIAAAQLSTHVKVVQGADTASMRKPSPTMLLSCASRVGVEVSRLLMVGDSAADMGAAAAAGCPAAWASWGYGSVADVEARSADSADPWRLDDPADLLAWLPLHVLAAD